MPQIAFGELASSVAAEAIDWATFTDRDWSWVERSVWKRRMLNTLIQRGEEQVWYSLIDKHLSALVSQGPQKCSSRTGIQWDSGLAYVQTQKS